jgi:hypothetical protein
MAFDLFNNDDTSDDERTDEMNDTTTSEPEETTVREVTDTKDYTEHDAEVTFTDGEAREYTFDAMQRGEHGITLKNYTGVHRKRKLHLGVVTRFASEAFAFIPYNNLQLFETVARRDREYEYSYEEEVPVSEADDNE